MKHIQYRRQVGNTAAEVQEELAVHKPQGLQAGRFWVPFRWEPQRYNLPANLQVLILKHGISWRKVLRIFHCSRRTLFPLAFFSWAAAVFWQENAGWGRHMTEIRAFHWCKWWSTGSLAGAELQPCLNNFLVWHLWFRVWLANQSALFYQREICGTLWGKVLKATTFKFQLQRFDFFLSYITLFVVPWTWNNKKDLSRHKGTGGTWRTQKSLLLKVQIEDLTMGYGPLPRQSLEFRQGWLWLILILLLVLILLEPSNEDQITSRSLILTVILGGLGINECAGWATSL